MDSRRDPLSLAGRVAVVTGAGRGIGAATARLFAEAGAQVALLDLNGAGVTHTAEEIALAGGEALSFETDITDAF
ncbi:MAG TPA: SDR family NAD(P)-dependent oxidoreductase, partial [Vicinamibacteria bacterium]